MALLDDLDVGHELLGPLDRASADAEDTEAEGEAEGEVHVADLAEHRDVDVGLGIDRDVGDDEEHHHEHGQQEESRHLALRAACGLGVEVAAARTMRDVGSGECAGALVERTSEVVRGDVPVPVTMPVVGCARAIARGEVAHRALIPIHTARPTKAAMAPAHRKRPSETGPRRPRERPPGFGACWRSMT